ncbi:MAG: HAMP domain-containing histidine kinase [Lachnospiraceae bacterium]|nr:HAMP domain-containing histidine kinase [Lachnospiraceae bacterium]
MKLRTRLLITFITMVFLPLALMALAFMSIEFYMTHTMQREYGFKAVDYEAFSNFLQTKEEQTAELFDSIIQTAENCPEKFEDKAFLSSLEEAAEKKASYIIVRKDGVLYYTGNQAAAGRIFSKLPPYGYDISGQDAGYYYNQLQKFVKQADFLFSDDSEGSIFVVTPLNGRFTKSFIIDMLVAITFILIFTALMLTQWIQKGIFHPIRNLNRAMQKIAEGDFDYALTTEEKGEFGDLFRNYEDMRLRLKESSEEKVQSERQNKELISNISHDLKTPITAIKGYVEGLMDGVADTPEKMDKYIRTIYNKAIDMDRLINELTFYSGIDSNRIPYNFHRINVSEYFRDCIEDVGLELESENIRLNYSNVVSPDTRIIADPEQLKRVINNIISNSIKYMDKPQGVIDIRILDEIDSIRVEIEDNGKGIAAKDLSNIFERFFRTDASRNSSKGGSGIGLSIVKKIIEDHGGYIWATSKEGEGTCLHFVIRKYREAET